MLKASRRGCFILPFPLQYMQGFRTTLPFPAHFLHTASALRFPRFTFIFPFPLQRGHCLKVLPALVLSPWQDGQNV
jgi:hypothetical protein